jgi:DNA polymerase elongation subunit (family B)
MQVIVTDIETMVEFFLCTCYDPQLDEWQEFEVNKNCNHIDQMVRYFEQKNDHYFVTYNGLRFDSQVLEFIIREHDKWHEKGSIEICSIIAQNAADTIHDSNFGVLPAYRENQLSFKILDLFEIHHFSNKNRMVSLKRLQFEMDLENIEEMPIHHNKENLTDEDIVLIKDYCKNDIFSTYEFYKVTIGETDHPLYKGNNQIQLRMDIQEEFKIPCLNYSDSKIGDEMIKKYYCEQKGITYKDLPKKGTFRKPFTVGSCVAHYVDFKTRELKEFLKRIKKVTLSLQDDFKEQLEFYGNTYTFAKGGLHTENGPKIFEADEDHLIVDWDVSSYYPAIIINNERYPVHLGKEFLSGYKQMFEKRLELKPLAKKDRKIKGIVGALKLAVNSVYGC